jgi:DNA-binding MarR family transcriptional regulator
MGNQATVAEVHRAVDCLGRLTEIFRQRRQELAASVNLTEQQWSVLDEIDGEAFMPSMFARQRESSAPAVSRILRQLQDKQLVVASLDPSDGRQRHYELTNAGKQVLSRLREHRLRAISEVWRFEQVQIANFTHFGNELIERLERYSKDNNARNTTGEGRGSEHGKDTVRQGV